MKRNINLLGVIVFSFILLNIVSCDKDDEPQFSGDNSFSFNNETCYFRYQFDWGWPLLIYDQRNNILQLDFNLSKTSSLLDNTPYVGGGIELTPFNPKKLKEGDPIEILSREINIVGSTYTCIRFDLPQQGYDLDSIKTSYIYVSGNLIFLNYDLSSEIVTLQFNKVVFKGKNPTDSCILDGIMKCQVLEFIAGGTTIYSGVYADN